MIRRPDIVDQGFVATRPLSFYASSSTQRKDAAGPAPVGLPASQDPDRFTNHDPGAAEELRRKRPIRLRRGVLVEGYPRDACPNFCWGEPTDHLEESPHVQGWIIAPLGHGQVQYRSRLP